MEANEIRKKFLNYFEKRGHTAVPSSSLIPDDSSVLLTTAGMQQFKKYYTGETDSMRDFNSKNTASVQKSFRTSDIDEVGDESHLTFFEMLGNFSFGGYWKKEAINFAYEFITKEMDLNISYVSIFKGTKDIPKDEESEKIWKSLGIADVREEGMADVFWGPTGTSGPCGPTTEIYCKNAAGKDIEIWNIVFNEFFCDGSREQLLAENALLKPLPLKGIDTGMGLERLAMISQKTKTIFETDLFLEPFLLFLKGNPAHKKEGRVIADHMRAAIFLLSDGVRPSNKDAGYILRRLIRRTIVQAQRLGFSENSLIERIALVINKYGSFADYSDLLQNEKLIKNEFIAEMEKFSKTLKTGMREFFNKFPEMKTQIADKNNPPPRHVIKRISGDDAFYFQQSFGLTLDIIKDLAKAGGHIVEINDTEFATAREKHREISRAGVEKKFGGHGLILNTGELKAGDEEELKIVTRLHTATHLLNAALHMILGSGIEQKGSDITAERTRFDFSFPRKLTPEEIKNIENIVNTAIKKNYAVNAKEYELGDAKRTGALYMKKGKYPEKVKVYVAGDEKEIFSQELCGGPHVTRTGEIGQFKIIKEEASSAGVRRIRATIC